MINKEKSKGMRKVLFCTLVAGVLLTSSLEVFAETPVIDSELQTHFSFMQEGKDYYDSVANANIEEYDENFVNLYRDGSLIILGKKYDLKHVYIVYDENGCDLIYSKEPSVNILTGAPFGGSTGKSVLKFKDSSIFYEIFSHFGVVDGNIIIDETNLSDITFMVDGYDGSIHRNVPETFYRYNEDYKHRK